jgi:hypothetical protein
MACSLTLDDISLIQESSVISIFTRSVSTRPLNRTNVFGMAYQYRRMATGSLI